ncbi:MAG: hypothetical protein ACI8QS_000576 [Planctomycetota bacterium]|jgi:hypothetical protein
MPSPLPIDSFSAAGGAEERLSMRRVFRLWLPLAASWLCMGFELPLFTAFVARMQNEEINLAAFGGVVFPLALVIEAPIIMLLAASAALAKDRDAYDKLKRFANSAGLVLTIVHMLVAFTPLFDLIVDGVFDVQTEVRDAARIGMRIMTPWTWAIAYRRFQQGVLIRFDRSRGVAIGTLLRLGTVLCVLFLGYQTHRFSGIVLGTMAIAIGVTVEALFSGACVRPILRSLMPAEPKGERLTLSAFLSFYLPLALTPLLTLLVPPIGTAAMSRMPKELASLAAWPAVHGLVFLTRSTGFALNEVVVTQIGSPGGPRILWRFCCWLAAATMGILLLLGLTPLADLWFRDVSDLSPAVYTLATGATALAVIMPGNQAFQSYYQGALVHAKHTRPITVSVAIYLVVAALLLAVGVALGSVPGILWTIPVLSFAGLCQTGWLALSSREVLRDLRKKDDAGSPHPQG